VPDPQPINWTNLLTLVSLAVLVGTEFAGISWAAGWALGGWFHMSDSFSRALEFVFVALGLIVLFFFMRQAVKYEPIRG
jgi:hypothetical protein